MKNVWWIVLFFLFFLLPTQTFATSSYVLPYPGAMPGNTLYKLHVVWEKVLGYWYFGNFGQFTYNLKEADTYLVQAKTLFEYNQYLLGYQSLQKSDAYFQNIKPFLIAASKEGKDITEKRVLLEQAAEKHSEVLKKMQQEVPQEFLWQPEKAAATNLNLHEAIMTSIAIRKKEL